MSLTVRVLRGSELGPVLNDLARLRIEVFREWPYLYDGDLAYEADYLGTFASSPGAVIVGAYDGDRMVGAATGAPMEDHAEDFARAFRTTGIALGDVFYCAESVLLPRYRGHGLGHSFFDMREAQARKLARRYAAFCAVNRPSDHPLRPSDYRPLDGFWKRRGYEMIDGAIATFTWKDVGQAKPTPKQLQFWIRDLTEGRL